MAIVKLIEFWRRNADVLGVESIATLTAACNLIHVFSNNEWFSIFILIISDHFGRVSSVAIVKLIEFSRRNADVLGVESIATLTATRHAMHIFYQTVNVFS